MKLKLAITREDFLDYSLWLRGGNPMRIFTIFATEQLNIRTIVKLKILSEREGFYLQVDKIIHPEVTGYVSERTDVDEFMKQFSRLLKDDRDIDKLIK
jgi:hypothetical protein